MIENTKTDRNTKNLSTRTIILTKSLELINEMGVIDFRIDNLAKTLSLSPGNITYHFSKKEDICIVLWQLMLDKLDTYDIMLSKMLDIKQSFLLFRGINHLLYTYRGVAMFRGGDTRTIIDDEKDSRSFNDHTMHIITMTTALLADNGYIRPGDYSETNTLIQSLTMRWWINYSATTRVDSNEEIPLEEITLNTLLILFSYYPIFTDKGHKEFSSLMNILSNNNMDI